MLMRTDVKVWHLLDLARARFNQLRTLHSVPERKSPCCDYIYDNFGTVSAAELFSPRLRTFKLLFTDENRKCEKSRVIFAFRVPRGEIMLGQSHRAFLEFPVAAENFQLFRCENVPESINCQISVFCEWPRDWLAKQFSAIFQFADL